MNNVFKNTKRIFNNSDSGLASSVAILSNNVYKVTYYEIISGASGTLTVPTGATINAGEFAGANCVLSEIDGADKPTYVTPLTSGGVVVTSTLNTGTGAWAKSGTTASTDVAIIYSINISAINYQYLNNFYIIENILLDKFIPRVTTITSNATPTINTDVCDAVTITALATAITSFTTNLSGTPTNFQKLIIRIKDDGTARAITWGTGFEAKGVALPTTTVISKVLSVGFIYDTVTSKWGCVASAQEA